MKCTCNSVRCICPTGHPLHRAYPHHCPYSPFNGSHIIIGKVRSILGHGEALACPSAHATDIETPSGPHGTCAGQHSRPSCIDEKKSKNCAQKHMAVPGRSVRWAHRAIRRGSRGGCGVLAANCCNCCNSSDSEVLHREIVSTAAMRAGAPTPQPVAVPAMEPGKSSTSARTPARHAPGEKLQQKYKCEPWLIRMYCRRISHPDRPERQLTAWPEHAVGAAQRCSQAHCKSQECRLARALLGLEIGL